MTTEQLGAIAGVILSLVLAYVPKVKEWYDAKSAPEKAQIMAGLLIVAALGVFGLSCARLYSFAPCTVDGAKDLLSVLIAALVANQGAFLLLVKPFRKEAPAG